MDGVRWNGKSFICAVAVDDGTIMTTEDDVDDYAADFDDWVPEQQARSVTVISLMDMARPAKLKGAWSSLIGRSIDAKTLCVSHSGIAKEFEVVEGVERVIALDEGVSEEGWQEDEDWEKIPGITFLGDTETYSDVLRSNVR